MQVYSPPPPPLTYVSPKEPGPENERIETSTVFLANAMLNPTFATDSNRVRIVNAGGGDTMILRLSGDHLVIGRDGVLNDGTPRSQPAGKYVVSSGSRIDVLLFEKNITFWSDCGGGLDLGWIGEIGRGNEATT